MENLTLRCDDSLPQSPQFPWFLRVYADLIEKSPAHTLNWESATKLVVAIEGQRPVGFLAFSIGSPKRIGWELLSYVEPDSRRQGVYSRMRSYMKHVLQSQSVHIISLNVRAPSEDMEHILKSVGYVPEFVRYSQRLKGKS